MSGADVLAAAAGAGAAGEARAGSAAAGAAGAADERSAAPSPWARYGPPGSPGRQLRHGAIGQLAARSLRFGSATGRSLAVRRAIGVPASVQANGAGLATVRAPRWWRRSARAVEATVGAGPVQATAGAGDAAVAQLPARGLRRVVRSVPTEESHGPGSLSVTAAPRTLPMRLPAEVTAAGAMITSLDRRRRTAPPPPRDAGGAQVGSPGKTSGAGSAPDLPRRGTSAGSPQAALRRDAEQGGPARPRPTDSTAAVTRGGAGAARQASTPGTPGRATPVSRFVRRRLAAGEAARAAADARAAGDVRATARTVAAPSARATGRGGAELVGTSGAGASRPAVSGQTAGISDAASRMVRRVPLSLAPLGVSPDGSAAVVDGATGQPLRRALGAPVRLRPAFAGAVGAPVGGGRVRSGPDAPSAGPRAGTRPTRGDTSRAMRAAAPAAASAASPASSAVTRSAVAPAPSAQPAAVRPTSAQPTAAQPVPSAPTAVQRTGGVPSVARPTAAQPTSARPAAAQPTSAQPAAAQPTSAQPAAAQPTSAQPAAVQRTAAVAASAQPSSASPGAAQSITAQPTAPVDADARPSTAPSATGPQTAAPTATAPSAVDSEADAAADAAGIPAGAGEDSAGRSATSVLAQRLAAPDAVVHGPSRRARRAASVRRYSGLPVAIGRLAVGHGADVGLVGGAASAGRAVRNGGASAVASARHAGALTAAADRGVAAGAGRRAAALTGGPSIAGGASLHRVAPRGVLPVPAGPGTRAGVPTDGRPAVAVRRVQAAPGSRSWSLGIVGPDGPGSPASPNRPGGPDRPRAPMRRRADPAATTVRPLVTAGGRPTPVSAPAPGDVRRSARAVLGAAVAGSAGPVEVAASTAVRRGSAAPTSHGSAGAALTVHRSVAGAPATSRRSPAAATTVLRSAGAVLSLHRSAAAPVELSGVASGFVVLPPRTTGLGGRPGGPPAPSSARAGRRPADRPAPSGPADAVRRSVSGPAPSTAGTPAGSVPARLAALVAAEAAGAFESTSVGRTGWSGSGPAFPGSGGSVGGPAGPAGVPGVATVLRTTEGAVMSPSAADRVSRSWSPPEDPSQAVLPPEVMDELVDRVVERLEDRVVEELERRGRRRMPGVF